VNDWSQLQNTDFMSGLSQNETGSDAISDEPFVIDVVNLDRYPLAGRFYDFASDGISHFSVVTNSTLLWMGFDSEGLVFKILDGDNVTGFCRVAVPTSLMNGSLQVLLNDVAAPSFLLACSSDRNVFLYFTHARLGQDVRVVPEFDLSCLFWGLVILALVTLTALRKNKEFKTGSYN
jgi:hypothetical protein